MMMWADSEHPPGRGAVWCSVGGGITTASGVSTNVERGDNVRLREGGGVARSSEQKATVRQLLRVLRAGLRICVEGLAQGMSRKVQSQRGQMLQGID
eukprot:gene16345-biopygen11292